MARTNTNTGGGGGGNVTGNGAINQVTFWTGANSIGGSPRLQYNPITNDFAVSDPVSGMAFSFAPSSGFAFLGTNSLEKFFINETAGTSEIFSRHFIIKDTITGGTGRIYADFIPSRQMIGDIADVSSQVKLIIEPDNSAIQFYGLGNFQTPPVSFFGIGLNDMTADTSGYTGTSTVTYSITVASTGATDTFDWVDNFGNSANGVPMSMSPITLSFNNDVQWGAITGHTLGDVWVLDINVIRAPFMEFNGSNNQNTIKWGDFSGINNGTKSELNDTTKTITWTADGWVSKSSDVPITVTIPISSAQILSLNSSPVQIIPTPGVGKYIDVITIHGKYTFGTTQYANSSLVFTEGSIASPIGFDGTTLLDTPVSQSCRFSVGAGIITENAPLMLMNTAVDPTGGDGTLDINVTYTIKSF